LYAEEYVPARGETVSAPKAEAMQRRKTASMTMIILFFIVGLSVLLSITWTPNSPVFNPVVLLFGILIAGIVFVAGFISRALSERPIQQVSISQPPSPAGPACASCGQPLIWVVPEGRWYCRREGQYR